jgi:hypothetical protein
MASRADARATSPAPERPADAPTIRLSARTLVDGGGPFIYNGQLVMMNEATIPAAVISCAR